MRHRRRRLRMNCFGCGRFWRRRRQALCDLFRLPLQYTVEELEARKTDLEERLENINRKLNMLREENKEQDMYYGENNG